MKAHATQFAAAVEPYRTERDSATGASVGGIEEATRNSLTRGPEMSNGTRKRRRDQPKSDADRSRDLAKLNQQVVSSDLFGVGRREEDFQPASPEVEHSPSGALLARSHCILELLGKELEIFNSRDLPWDGDLAALTDPSSTNLRRCMAWIAMKRTRPS